MINAAQANNKTLKETKRLINKYIKLGKHSIKKQIRDAQKYGDSRAMIIISDRIFINTDIIRAVRKVLVEFLETNGFYVRKYTSGHKTEIADPEQISFAWGPEIEHAREIDAIYERMAKETRKTQNEAI